MDRGGLDWALGEFGGEEVDGEVEAVEGECGVFVGGDEEWRWIDEGVGEGRWGEGGGGWWCVFLEELACEVESEEGLACAGVADEEVEGAGCEWKRSVHGFPPLAGVNAVHLVRVLYGYRLGVSRGLLYHRFRRFRRFYWGAETRRHQDAEA